MAHANTFVPVGVELSLPGLNNSPSPRSLTIPALWEQSCWLFFFFFFFASRGIYFIIFIKVIYSYNKNESELFIELIINKLPWAPIASSIPPILKISFFILSDIILKFKEYAYIAITWFISFRHHLFYYNNESLCHTSLQSLNLNFMILFSYYILFHLYLIISLICPLCIMLNIWHFHFCN